MGWYNKEVLLDDFVSVCMFSGAMDPSFGPQLPGVELGDLQG